MVTEQIDLILAAFAAGVVITAILLLTRREATDPGRDSRALMRSEATGNVYVVVQSPAETHNYHHYDGEITIRHEHSGSVRHQHAHQHTHTLAAADNYGYQRLIEAQPRRSLSALDSPSYRQRRIGDGTRREYADRY